MELKEYIEKGLCHSIHTSVRRSFRSCRRRWDWSYREMYYPKVTPPPLEFGVAFHRGMELFYEPKTWENVELKRAMSLVGFKDSCTKQIKEYTRLNGEPEVAKIDEYNERIKLGLGMMRFYTQHVSPFVDVGFTPVAVEYPFEIAILSPTGEAIWCRCSQCWTRYENWLRSTYPKGDHRLADAMHERFPERWQGLPVTYGGRLDMLAKDDLGRYWIYDWKTTSRILDEDAEASFLQLDDQISSYVWALRSLGLPIAGFVYVEIKKSYPQPPEELSRLYKGRRFSTNKQWHTTEAIYRNHVSEHDSLAFAEGLYDEHLAWLKAEGPKFHQRHQVHKNDHEVDEIGQNIYLEALDIVEPNVRVYPQPGRFSCPTCMYRQPCLGKNMGEDYTFTLEALFEKRTRHYYDEKAPSTD